MRIQYNRPQVQVDPCENSTTTMTVMMMMTPGDAINVLITAIVHVNDYQSARQMWVPLMLHSIGLGNLYLRVVENIVPLVRSYISKWETRNSASTPTSDSEMRVGKYEFPSPVERSIRLTSTQWYHSVRWTTDKLCWYNWQYEDTEHLL